MRGSWPDGTRPAATAKPAIRTGVEIGSEELAEHRTSPAHCAGCDEKQHPHHHPAGRAVAEQALCVADPAAAHAGRQALVGGKGVACMEFSSTDRGCFMRQAVAAHKLHRR